MNHRLHICFGFNTFDPDAVNPDNPANTYTHCDVNMDFGITFAVHPRVQLDAYAGFNLYNDEPAVSGPKNSVFAGLGVTWLIYNPRPILNRQQKNTL
ncbi:MAG: hypothetical protein IJ814_00040 [Paludibacteraceae bacterium]|nr:hypothetical protein [Paludibacteraceae bacterium]